MAQCITPFHIKDKITGETFAVPCGKCPQCVKRRQSGWSFRLMQEEKHSTSAQFLTLTYDTKYLPITKSGDPTLNKRDVQLFMKRLRKAHPKGVKLKYYCVGEYGGHSGRPHYHMLLFNADINKISPAWNLGTVHFGAVSETTVGYSLKYMMKQSSNIRPVTTVGKLGKITMEHPVQKEFALMSKGIGKCYMTQAMIKWHKADLENRMYVNLTDGKKASMPRYFKDKIYSDMERKRIAWFMKWRMEHQEMEKQADPEYSWVKAQSDQAQFRKMKHKSTQGLKL